MNNMPNPNLSPLWQPAPTPRHSQQQQATNNILPPQYSVPGVFDGTAGNFMNRYENTPNEMDISELLERYIGKIIKAEFLLGDILDDRVGRLLSVGNNYIVLGMLESKIVMVCSTDTLKFATVILDEENTGVAF